MRDCLNITKALSDESRVRIVMFLRDGELCACQIIEMLELAPSTISRHMAVLLQAGLVECRKCGKWHYYRLPGTGAPAPVQNALVWLESALAQSPVISADGKRLKALLKRDLKTLCARHK